MGLSILSCSGKCQTQDGKMAISGVVALPLQSIVRIGLALKYILLIKVYLLIFLPMSFYRLENKYM